MEYSSRLNRYRPKRKAVNLKKVGTLVTLVVFVILVFTCIRYFSLFNVLSGSAVPKIWRPENAERVQYLLAGRQDGAIITCSLLSIPAGEDQPVYVLRIPVETLLNPAADSGPPQSLAQVFLSDGAEAGIEDIDILLGNKLAVDHYVFYDTEIISEVVGAIGGVEVELPAGFNVSYGDTDYVFASGINQIQADNLVPLVASNSRLEAAAFWAEKSMLVQVFNDLFSIGHISYSVANLSKVSDICETDLSAKELAKFRDTLQALAWDSKHYVNLPGSWVSGEGQEYWRIDDNLLVLTVRQVLENLPPYDRTQLYVDVFNGNGVTGFAAKTANLLRDLEYRIGKVDNAEDKDITEIYFQSDYKVAAMEIALILDVNAVMIEGSYTNNDSPVTVILGRDLIGR